MTFRGHFYDFIILLILGMHQISGWPDIRPDNLAFFYIFFYSRLSGQIEKIPVTAGTYIN
jgi:hypothetical protein